MNGAGSRGGAARASWTPTSRQVARYAAAIGTGALSTDSPLWTIAARRTGYGDAFPVTGTGRVVAVALMLVGISLAGVITATVAAWFISQSRDAAGVKDTDVSERLSRIETTLAEILAGLQPEGNAAETRSADHRPVTG